MKLTATAMLLATLAIAVTAQGGAPHLPAWVTSGTVSYVHQVITSPGDHCLEITIPGGTDSPFWKDEGWKYSAPVRPEWGPGQCDHTKWKTLDSKTTDYDGYTAVKNAPYAGVFLIKYGLEGETAPDAGGFSATANMFSTLVKSYVHPTEPHCEMVTCRDVTGSWWKANGWRYNTWTSGPCPGKFNFVNEKDAPAPNVEHQTMGVKTADSMVDTFADVPIHCNSQGAKTRTIAVVNKLSDSIKLRTCHKSVDPVTGWACNHGGPDSEFIDCATHIQSGISAVLEIDVAAVTALPVLFAPSGAVDKVSNCYMTDLSKPVTMDQAWWDALQKSC